MINTITNYEKTKISMANIFLQYDQKAMIKKFSLEHDPDWLSLTFVNRIYRINRQTGSIQWSNDAFETVYEADYNEAMTIYDVLCYSKDGCHLANEFVNINSLSTIRSGNPEYSSTFWKICSNFFSPSINTDASVGLLRAVSMPITAYGQPANVCPVALPNK